MESQSRELVGLDEIHTLESKGIELEWNTRQCVLSSPCVNNELWTLAAEENTNASPWALGNCQSRAGYEQHVPLGNQLKCPRTVLRPRSFDSARRYRFHISSALCLPSNASRAKHIANVAGMSHCSKCNTSWIYLLCRATWHVLIRY